MGLGVMVDLEVLVRLGVMVRLDDLLLEWN